MIRNTEQSHHLSEEDASEDERLGKGQGLGDVYQGVPHPMHHQQPLICQAEYAPEATM